ncbi:PiggyBac transposable element-derived protein 4 [Larimichthys crocea]|uniref:PiggyBac transposable element-derived protein 4 n=1 Tax=Larimichthys crocea TaxID=215358 RepID=A0A6G0ID20_LARCR|nr:PiggyBac transposable element-derived protein 4 [Larimichthys crocea]
MKKHMSLKEALSTVLQSSEGEEDTSSITDSGNDYSSGEVLPAFEDGSSSREEEEEGEGEEDDNEEEMEDQEEDKGAGWNSKNGKLIWAPTHKDTLRKRFMQISTALRFDDRLSRPARQRRDKLAAIRELWDVWSTRLPVLFTPGRDVCVDEQLVPFKGRCLFKEYIPSKPAKYGLKVWVLCDVETSYAWKMQVYTGRSPGAMREVNQGMRVALEMTEGLEGHTVTVDNFFTSFPLAEELHKWKMTLVGTLRKNKPELPPQLLQTRLRPVVFSRTQTAVSYIPKKGKNVVLLSTKHRDPAVEEGPKRKPKIIVDYNHCKDAVDNLDKVVGTYSCSRRSSRPVSSCDTGERIRTSSHQSPTSRAPRLSDPRRPPASNSFGPGRLRLPPGNSSLGLGRLRWLPGNSSLGPGRLRRLPGNSSLGPGRLRRLPGNSNLWPSGLRWFPISGSLCLVAAAGCFAPPLSGQDQIK